MDSEKSKDLGKSMALENSMDSEKGKDLGKGKSMALDESMDSEKSMDLEKSMAPEKNMDSEIPDSSALPAAEEPVCYLCGHCGAGNGYIAGDTVQCKQCGFRVLYKKRTRRMVPPRPIEAR